MSPPFSVLPKFTDLMCDQLFYKELINSECLTDEDCKDMDESLDLNELEEVFSDHILLGKRLQRSLYKGSFEDFDDSTNHPPMALTGLSETLSGKLESTTSSECVAESDPGPGGKYLLTGSAESEILTDEEKSDLLVNARSIDRLVKWSGCFLRSDNGLLCKYCGSTLIYDFNLGDSFTDSNLPAAFRHLKYDVKRHLNSDKHLTNSKNFQIEQAKATEFENSGKLNALNCANAAYFIYKKNMSYESYESLISVLYNSGCNVGVKNHSKEFPRLFLSDVHSVLQQEICNYIISNDLPVGVVADKVTVNHRSRQVVGLRVPIFDLNRNGLFHALYLEHKFVDDFTGLGLATNILKTLRKFGFDLEFLRKNLIGLAVDGQYVKLGVANHMKSVLCVDKIPTSWDLMHRIELVQKHAEMPGIIKKVHTLIHDSMKEFMQGMKYEKLLKCSKLFSDVFYRPKIFKTMKFVSYSNEIFKTFIGDYKALIAACEENEDLFALRDRLLSKSQIFHMLLISDIYNMMAKYSKLVQKIDNLPWEYLQLVKNMKYHLEIYVSYFDDMTQLENTQELCSFIEKLPVVFFSNTKTSVEIFQLCTYQGIALPDKPVSSKILRTFSKTITNECDNLTENFKRDMECFVQFTKSLLEQYDAFTKDESVDDILKRASYLFNFEFLYFPRTDCSVEQSSEDKGFCLESFHKYIGDFPFYNTFEYDIQTLWFEYKQLWDWLILKISESRNESNNQVYDVRALLKLAVLELKSKYPGIIKFLIYALSIPVSEAVCESWGSVINDVMVKRPTANDGKMEEVGTTDMRVFIMLNGPPPEYKSCRKFLEVALMKKYGISYWKYFKYVSTNNAMKKYVTSKVITKAVENISNCLPCFN